MTQQQREHEQQFPRSYTTPHIMNIYQDYALAEPDLLIALNFLQPTKDMKLYKLLSNAWNKVTITLSQLARNIQTIIDAFVYSHARSKLYPKVQRVYTRCN